jgi:hypothetical protein
VIVVEKFLNNCDINKAMSLITKQKFNWNEAMANSLDNAQENVKEHKLQRNTKSLAVMQVILEFFDNTA